MPPFIPQKRVHASNKDHRNGPPQPRKRSRQSAACRDSRTLQDNKTFVESLEEPDDESSLSEIDSDEFEDIDLQPSKPTNSGYSMQNDDDSIDWEDAIDAGSANMVVGGEFPARPKPSKDFEITLNGKTEGLEHQYTERGPTKRERLARLSVHRMHVQYLLFHNLIRNGFARDPSTQQILREQLPLTVQHEVERWRRTSGLDPTDQEGVPQARVSKEGQKGSRRSKQTRNQRDWGQPAERLERGTPDLSRGDPLLRILKVLAIYWRKRFVIVAPSLRKQGYKPLAVLKDDLLSWRSAAYFIEEHGECIEDLESFRKCAKVCEGSRDIGSQLFTALVCSVGIEARLVASLQPLGYGWTQTETASLSTKSHQHLNAGPQHGHSVSQHDTNTEAEKSTLHNGKPPQADPNRSFELNGWERGARKAPTDLIDETEFDVRSADILDEDDDESVVDVTPKTPCRKANKIFDDLPTPTYWTEAVSPISCDIVPVDPFINNPAVVTKAEHLVQFEPRGKKAERAKQVLAYVVAYSYDGTAKDVTTRYLRRHQWPGVTRGFRLPTERIAVRKSNGKITHYEQYDWFKRVIRGYERQEAHRTAVDDREDAQDLMPVKAPIKEARVMEETLQGYKTSAEFVLERHLKREEAIRPGSQPVKMFTSGKQNKGEHTKQEPVFPRKDVEVCRTAESWHKEGRAIKPHELPMKNVKVRAVTANRKREVEEAERGGETLMQGMYAKFQTDWIIPDPIQNGLIPKNAYGNIDCFVPSMVPEGAVHIPMRQTVKVCKRLGIDYAEAVTGFDFGNRIAIPLLTGVVIAEENQDMVMEAWKEDEQERRVKEEGKREKGALVLWRKWMMGLRILHRVNLEYGDNNGTQIADELNPFTNSKGMKVSESSKKLASLSPAATQDGSRGSARSNGFICAEPDDFEGGGFLLDDDEEHTPAGADRLILNLDDDNNNDSPHKNRTLSPSVPWEDDIAQVGSHKRIRKQHQDPAANPSSQVSGGAKSVLATTEDLELDAIAEPTSAFQRKFLNKPAKPVGVFESPGTKGRTVRREDGEVGQRKGRSGRPSRARKSKSG